MQDLLKCYLCKRDLDLLRHSEVDCLREQLRLSRLEVEAWKGAWHDQRRATGIQGAARYFEGRDASARALERAKTTLRLAVKHSESRVLSRFARRLAQTAMHVVDEVRVKRETRELGAIGALQHDALMVQFNEEV